MSNPSDAPTLLVLEFTVESPDADEAHEFVDRMLDHAKRIARLNRFAGKVAVSTSLEDMTNAR